MRIAVLSDIHSNWTALQSVTGDLKSMGPDLILHAGDLVGSGSRPAEVIDLIRDLRWPGVVGNTDQVLWNQQPLEALSRSNPAMKSLWDAVFRDVESNRQAVGEARIRWLETLPDRWCDCEMAVVHASPGDCWRAPSAIADDGEFERVYGSLMAPLVVYGHVHQPFVRRLPGFVIANSGSVGLPYDGDPRASYLLIDDGLPTIRRVSYNIDAELNELAAAGYPQMEWIGTVLRGGRFVPPFD